MARYHGKSAVVYVSPTGTGAAVIATNLSEWSVNFNTDKAECTAFGDANKTYVVGLKDVQGTFSGFFDDATTAALMTAADSADGTKLYLYPSSNAVLRYFYGPAWMDLSVTVSVGDAAKVSGTFAANGAWGNKLA